MTVRREAISWIVTIVVTVIVGFVIVYVTTTAAFASTKLSPLDLASVRQKIADYSADEYDQVELKPLEAGLIDEAQHEDSALNRRQDELGGVTPLVGPVQPASIIQLILPSWTPRPTLVVEVRFSSTPSPTASPTTMATVSATPFSTLAPIVTDAPTFSPTFTPTAPAAVLSPTSTFTSTTESNLTRTAASPAIVNPTGAAATASSSPTRSATPSATVTRIVSSSLPVLNTNTPTSSTTPADSINVATAASLVPTKTATSTRSSTPTKTAWPSPTATPTPTYTATFTPTPTDTQPPIVILTDAPGQDCAIAAGNLSVVDSELLVLTIQNAGAATVMITGIEVAWPAGSDQRLEGIRFGGEVIWEGPDSNPPAVIPAEGGWAGNDSYRELGFSSSKNLRMRFDQDLHNGGYSVQVQFNNGCVVGASN